MKNLLSGLAKFQALNLTLVKDSTNPHFKKQYLSLDKILNVIRPQLFELGLVLFYEIKDGNIFCHITHIDSNETITSSIPIMDSSNPQHLGSYITYMKRYLISAMLALATEEDDDGNYASNNKKEQPKKDPPKQEQPKKERKMLSDERVLKKFNLTVSEVVETAEGAEYLRKLYNDGEIDLSERIKTLLSL